MPGRSAGTSYFGHLMVADVLFDAGASREMIAAGYLHRAVARGAGAGEIERDFQPRSPRVPVSVIAGTGRAPARASYTAIELERLAAEVRVQPSGLPTTWSAARAHLLGRRPARCSSPVTALEQLLLADAQVRIRYTRSSRWTDSAQPAARDAHEWSAHSRRR
jgi:hypothetical protein